LKLVIGVKPYKYKNGLSGADIVKINEYGTANIPPRPAFNLGFHKALEKRQDRIKNAIRNLVTLSLSKTESAKNEFNLIEKRILAEVGISAKKEIKFLVATANTELLPNAARTVKRKGFDNPLYETGQLLKNIDFEII